jgi:hypothetical protein
MSKKIIHIIHKLNLDIDVPDERLARSMYQRAGSLLQDYVLPQLEMLLKQYDEEGIHIRLDKLDINLNADHTSSFEKMIKEQLANAIAKELEVVIQTEKRSSDQKIKPVRKPANEHEHITEAFLWFLEHGTLPWWIADNTTFSESQEIINAITHSEETFIPLFIKKLQTLPVMRKRLLLQFDTILLTYLFSLVVPLEIFTTATRYEQNLAVLSEKKFGSSDKQWYWAGVWTLYPVSELLFVSSEHFQEKLDRLVEIISKQKQEQQSFRSLSENLVETSFTPDFKNSEDIPVNEEPEAENKIDNLEIKLPETEDGVLGSNAGLVLLHPFLQYFFKELGLLNNESFKDNASRETAVHLLHFLATGKEHAADFDLVFEKYLCGMSISKVTYRFTMLSEQMKIEAGTLLQSVIKHWDVLRNTSIEGLREGFLQRKGKLIVTGNNSRIVMEQNTLDILLQKVPWNISLLKLPWMDHLIHVEWMNQV